MPDPTEPSPGDIVFCCEHCPSPLEAHQHFVDEKVGYAKTDRRGKVISRLLAKWLLLCSACEATHGADVLSALETGATPSSAPTRTASLKVGGDMIWPDDVETIRVREEANKLLDERCPPGWTREMVKPPWAHQNGMCRACGKTGDGEYSRWILSTLIRFDAERKVMRFSFAMICNECKNNETKMQELSNRVFDAQ